MIKKQQWSLILGFALFSLNGHAGYAKGQSTKVDKCQSSSFCVHSNMPNYSQNDSRFLSAIGQTRDQGYCAAGVSAMIFKTYFDNLESTTNTSTSKIMSNSRDVGSIIKKAGELVKTNFKKGGTYNTNTKKGFLNYLRQVIPRFSKLNQVRNIGYETTHPRLRSRVDVLSVKIFKTEKPLWYLSVNFKGNNNHALVWNGYQGGKQVIYDPWGRIYNVKVSKQYISHPSSYGYVKYYAGSSGKVSVQKVVALK